jgi:nucleotide-binding universal stress UspA family protein
VIVVGVDGSEGAKGALRFALDEARLRGAAVRAVAAWHVPSAAYGGPSDTPDMALIRRMEPEARSALERAVAEAGDLTVELEVVVREGAPAQVLLDESQDAELLVVGSRGLGGFRGLLLGSVSQQCSHHASCPVVIVPHSRELSTGA